MKPMLAAKCTIEQIKYPIMASPKLDGVRGLVYNGVLLSRSMKPIPNKHIARLLSGPAFESLDGEIVCGLPTGNEVYRNSCSGAMTENSEPQFMFYVFDDFSHPNQPAVKRYADMVKRLDAGKVHPFIRAVPQVVIINEEQLLTYEAALISEGYEGVMLRDPRSPYKFGRSTTKEGWLLKLKRFDDSEAMIIGFEEQMYNGNEATTNELGYTKRSSHAENKVGKGTLGALVVRDINTGQEFNIGTGFDDATKKAIWGNQSVCMGAIVKYKYFSVGVKDLPRHPVFLGVRSELDI